MQIIGLHDVHINVYVLDTTWLHFYDMLLVDSFLILTLPMQWEFLGVHTWQVLHLGLMVACYRLHMLMTCYSLGLYALEACIGDVLALVVGVISSM